ncbi:hypothetical protein [Burkholderia cenocepacia]|uniref:hypothetical protein n=1 Tax=Burkholderia cenocepacia TaxID=95486 RepID=UPI00222E7AE5|nr:hypothetical protein [Burkholderia cenocepacia]MCW3657885.1 hypothetical protein [Burkholderia cenocepacia]MDS0807529.1 hypothetical protein [Burkholderia cenocepacia]
MSEANTAPLWNGTPLLPPIGCEVLISHGRDSLDHLCIVTGYEALPSLDGDTANHRLFVHVVYKHNLTTTNARLLRDIRPLTKARSIAQGGA